MTNPFGKVTSVGPRDRPKEPGVTFEGKGFGAHGSGGHDADIQDTANSDTTVLPFPSGSQRGGSAVAVAGSWLSELPLGSVRYSVALFAGLKRTLPNQELSSLPWGKLVEAIAPDDPPIVRRKDEAPYFITATLQEAPFVGRTLDRAERNNRPLIGKQRSGDHIQSCGPALALDIDASDVFELEPMVRALGCAAVMYSSYGYGSQRDDGSVKLSGRIVLAGDRAWAPHEHRFVMAAANDVLGDNADTQAMSTAQAMGVYVRRASDAACKRVAIYGGVISIDKLVDHGRSLVPDRDVGKPSTSASQSPAWKIKLALDGMPNDETTDYTKWVVTAGAVYSALQEAALELFQEWSARNLAKHDPGFTETKYLDHAADIRFGADGLMWTARRRAEDIAHTLCPQRLSPREAHLRQLAASMPAAARHRAAAINGDFAGGISAPRLRQVLDRDKLISQFGSASAALTWAVAFMTASWSEKVSTTFLAAYQLPSDVIEKGKQSARELREQGEAQGRTVLDLEEAIHENVENIANALLEKVARGELPLFQQGHSTLVQIRTSVSGQTKAVTLAEPASLRTLVSEHIMFRQPSSKPNGQSRVISPLYTGRWPIPALDSGVLKDLLIRALPNTLPELLAVTLAPFMPNLPANASDVLRANSDEIVTAQGYHKASKLYLAPEIIRH
jgi:hypothetical protein